MQQPSAVGAAQGKVGATKNLQDSGIVFTNTRDDHGGEFTRTFQKTGIYYRTIMGILGLNP